MSLQQRALIPAQDPEHKCINPDGVCPFMVEADRQARLLPYIHLVAHWFQRELDEEGVGSEKLDPLSFFQTHADVFCHEQFFERASGLITEAYYDDHRNTAFYSIAMPGRAVDGDVEEWGCWQDGALKFILEDLHFRLMLVYLMRPGSAAREKAYAEVIELEKGVVDRTRREQDVVEGRLEMVKRQAWVNVKEEEKEKYVRKFFGDDTHSASGDRMTAEWASQDQVDETQRLNDMVAWAKELGNTVDTLSAKVALLTQDLNEYFDGNSAITTARTTSRRGRANMAAASGREKIPDWVGELTTTTRGRRYEDAMIFKRDPYMDTEGEARARILRDKHFLSVRREMMQKRSSAAKLPEVRVEEVYFLNRICTKYTLKYTKVYFSIL
jgi:hypothetical protein